MIQRLLVIILGIAVLGAVVVGEARKRWGAPLQITQPGFTLIISQGDSLQSVVDTLHTSGVLKHPMLLTLFGRWTGLDQQIKHGEYLLPPTSTAESVLMMLQRGDVVKYQVTLPEGITLATAVGILTLQQQLKRVLSGPHDDRLLQLVKPQLHPEGLFFPDTYHYTRGDTDLSIMQRAHAAMVEVLQSEWRNRSARLPYKTRYEALIMASIIERETGIPEERKQISGVFVRRLEQGMLLQTDPTVIYGLGVDFDGNLLRDHLKDSDNPYNTYRRPGLPPTPIALPGQAAIHAALHPDEGDSLYFVARGDGSHIFSPTLQEHNRAVREYQLRRRDNYSSTPRKSPQHE